MSDLNIENISWNTGPNILFNILLLFKYDEFRYNVPTCALIFALSNGAVKVLEHIPPKPPAIIGFKILSCMLLAIADDTSKSDPISKGIFSNLTPN